MSIVRTTIKRVRNTFSNRKGDEPASEGLSFAAQLLIALVVSAVVLGIIRDVIVPAVRTTSEVTATTIERNNDSIRSK
ncbi:hypothetical protein [Clostridium perfringens]|uniref:hypothetical protein n=1 Tax=Clostridium perfringens TaxID=1502 RepID=UPI0024BCFC22|nr:hypothetical protein [Clostridium perfringens]